MNLISCDDCGVVLDKNKLVFPSMWKYEDDNEIDPMVAVWDRERYWSSARCPVCQAQILGEET